MDVAEPETSFPAMLTVFVNFLKECSALGFYIIVLCYVFLLMIGLLKLYDSLSSLLLSNSDLEQMISGIFFLINTLVVLSMLTSWSFYYFHFNFLDTQVRRYQTRNYSRQFLKEKVRAQYLVATQLTLILSPNFLLIYS